MKDIGKSKITRKLILMLSISSLLLSTNVQSVKAAAEGDDPNSAGCAANSYDSAWVQSGKHTSRLRRSSSSGCTSARWSRISLNQSPPSGGVWVTANTQWNGGAHQTNGILQNMVQSVYANIHLGTSTSCASNISPTWPSFCTNWG